MEFAMRESTSEIQQKTQQLFRSLDKGIDDMEQGKELPLREAFQKISEVREQRKYGRV